MQTCGRKELPSQKFRVKIICSNGIYSKQATSSAATDVRDKALIEVYAGASIE